MIGRWVPSPNPLSPYSEADNWSTSRDVRSSTQAFSRRTSFSSNASDIDYPRRKGEPVYSFVGMHFIFDQCKAMVYGNTFFDSYGDKVWPHEYGSACLWSIGWKPDCVYRVYATISSEAVHRAHKKMSQVGLTDFDFSANNQYITSTSIDKTVRVWDIPKGLCMRVIYGVSSQLCIRFNPVNNNFLSMGNENKEIMVILLPFSPITSKKVIPLKP
ncbi:hypothetical protein ACS0TY_003672 [Phlomoides rotata]